MGGLVGRRVLVTRATDQASALSALLRQYGAVPLELATIAIVPASEHRALDHVLQTNQASRWAVFTSANAVRFTGEYLNSVGRTWQDIAIGEFAAIGEATAASLIRRGLICSFQPSLPSGIALATELPDVSEQHVLFPRGNLADIKPVHILRSRGGVVNAPIVYRTVPDHLQRDRLNDTLRHDQIDDAIILSPSAFHGLLELLEPEMRHKLASIRIICTSPAIADAVRASGFTPLALPVASNTPMLIALLDHT